MKETKVLGIRYYGPEEMKTYNQVKNIANENKLSMSKTGKLLINRGLQHISNPRPLTKDSNTKKELERCTDALAKSIDKTVDLEEKLRECQEQKKQYTQEHIGGDPKAQQLLSGDKLKTGDKASSPQDALEVKKSPTQDSKKTDWAGGIAITGLIATAGFLLWCAVTK